VQFMRRQYSDLSFEFFQAAHKYLGMILPPDRIPFRRKKPVILTQYPEPAILPRRPGTAQVGVD
jgi:hypothetical protein